MLLLPTTLTHREARESLSMLGLALKRETDADDVVVDASGLQHFDSSALAVLLERGHHQRKLPVERIVALTAEHPARRFRLPGKGSVRLGNDADLVLVERSAIFTLAADELQQRHKASPYLGHPFRGTHAGQFDGPAPRTSPGS